MGMGIAFIISLTLLLGVSALFGYATQSIIENKGYLEN